MSWLAFKIRAVWYINHAVFENKHRTIIIIIFYTETQYTPIKNVFQRKGTKSTLNNVEVIDLTSSPSGPPEPAMKPPTVNFKYNERTMSNGSGKSYGRDRQYNPRNSNGNSSGSRKNLPANPFKKAQSMTVRNIMPAGYDEDEDDDDDSLEYN